MRISDWSSDVCSSDLNVTLPEGTSIMRAASLLGGSIPKLCATDSVESFGSCRLCLVEVEGRNGYPASCTTPVAEGMVVRRSEEHTSELQSLMRISYAVFCLKKKKNNNTYSRSQLLLTKDI